MPKPDPNQTPKYGDLLKQAQKAQPPAPAQPAPAPAPTPQPAPAYMPQVSPWRQAVSEGGQANAVPAQQPHGYWEDPRRVARYYNFIRSTPPGQALPDWMDAKAITEAYDYLKMRNDNKPWQEWKMLPADDPGLDFLNGMATPPIGALLPGERHYASTLTQEQVDAQKPLNWNNLESWEQLVLGALAPQTPGISDRPGANKASAIGVSTLMQGLGGLGIGSMFGPVGAAIGAGIGIGAGIYTGLTGKDVPGYSQLMKVLSYGGEKWEQAFGFQTMLIYEMLDAVSKGGDFSDVEDILQNLPEAWESSKYFYESLNLPVPGTEYRADIMNLMALAGRDTPAKLDEAWQFQKGIAEPVKIDGPTGTFSRLRLMRQLLSDYKAKGMTDDEAAEMLYIELIDKLGYNAMIGDMALQNLLDPLNIMPSVGTEIGVDVGIRTKNPQLQKAFEATRGSLVVDMIPFPLQSAFELITGKHGSAGPVAGINLYKSFIKQGYFPGGMDSIAAKDLPDAVKRFGGLTIDGRIKELEVKPKRGGIAGFKDYLTDLTPPAKAHVFLNMAHDNLNAILSLANGDPDTMLHLLNQAAGIEPVKAGDLGKALLDSPTTATIQLALRQALKKGNANEMLAAWVTGENKRLILEKVAEALGEKPADVIQQMTDAPDVLAARLNRIAPELKTTPEFLTDTLKVFAGDDPMPFNANQFQAQLAVHLFDNMDEFIQTNFGLKPDHWVFRVSQTLKGMQSLLLLGLNPAYFVNNQINNMVTRAAVGVFGYMTPKQIDGYIERFGLKPSRMDVSLGAAETEALAGGLNAVRKATQTNDIVGKVQRVVDNANKKLGIFSRFSSSMERLEGKQAMTIGMRQFWERSWKEDAGFKRMSPAIEAMIDQAAPGAKDLIYSAVRAGLNMDEIEGALFGKFIQPQIDTVADMVDAQLFPDRPGMGKEILTKTGTLDVLKDKLKKAETPADVDRAFAEVEADLQAVLDEAHSREVVSRAASVRDMVKTERIPAVLQFYGDMAIESASRWLITRREWADLYANKQKGLYSPEQWHAEVRALDAKHEQDWRRLNETQLATYRGIAEELGIATENSRAFIAEFAKQNQAWREFYAKRRELMRTFFDQSRRQDGEKWEAYEKRSNALWEKLQDELESLYDKHTDQERDSQRVMDQLFGQMYAEYTGWDQTRAAAWRQGIWDKRYEMIGLQRGHRAKTRRMTPEERDRAYAEFNQVYNSLIADMKQMEHDGAYSLMNKEAPPPPQSAPEQQAQQGVQIPMMITRKMRESLGEMGYTPEQIREMTPQQAWDAMREGGPKPEPEPLTAEEMPAFVMAKAKAAGIVDKKGRPVPKWALNVVNKHLRGEGKPEVADLGKADLADIQAAFDAHKIAHAHEKAQDLVRAKLSAEDIIRMSETAEREAAIKAAGMLSRRTVREKFINEFKITEEQADAAMLAMDLHADLAVKKAGFIPSEAARDSWYATHIADITQGNGEGLFQKYQVNNNSGMIQMGGGTRLYSTAWPANPEGYIKLAERGYQDMQQHYDLKGKTPDEVLQLAQAELEPYRKNRALKIPPNINAIQTFLEGLKYLRAQSEAWPTEWREWKATNKNNPILGYVENANIPNTLYQADQGGKGSVQFLDDGRAIIRALNAPDLSTVMHEIGHIWRRELTIDQLDTLAAHFGMQDGEEIVRLQIAFQEQRLSPDSPEYKKFVDMEEGFARGLERYWAEGYAPTPALRSLFKKFTDWFLGIYKRLRTSLGRVAGFENEPDFTIAGKTIDIQQKINGVALRDLYDQLLVERVNRPPDYRALLEERIDQVRNAGRNHRLTSKAIELKAQRELIRDLLGEFKSLDEAEQYANGLNDYHKTGAGRLVDETAIIDAVQAAKKPELNPWQQRDVPMVKGTRTKAYGVDDPSKVYEMTYTVMDLDDVIASDVFDGDRIVLNPDYDQLKQPRDRSENISRDQIEDRAARLEPSQVLDEFKAIDRGAPIVDQSRMVLSGNGRMLFVRRAIDAYPERWKAYRAALDEYAPNYGIDPASYQSMQHPVLVRMLNDDLDPMQAKAFVADANSRANLEMTNAEIAANDVDSIQPSSIALLEIGEEDTIEGMFSRAANKEFVLSFIQGIPLNERGKLYANGALTGAGLARLKNAIFAAVYTNDAAKAILQKFANSQNDNIKTIESAMMKTLPQVAKLDAQVKLGRLNPDLSIANDLAVAADRIAWIRGQKDLTVDAFLAQPSITEPVTQVQAILMKVMSEARNEKHLREVIRQYAEVAIKEPDPRQSALFGMVESRNKKEILENVTGKVAEEISSVARVEEPSSARIEAGTEPGTEAGANQPAEVDATAAADQALEGEPGRVEPAAPEQEPWRMTNDEYLKTDEGRTYYEQARQEVIGEIERRIAEYKKSRSRMDKARIPSAEKQLEQLRNGAEEGINQRMLELRALDYGKRRAIIEKALQEGKEVPAEVMLDYTDLAQNQRQASMTAQDTKAEQVQADFDAGRAVPVENAPVIKASQARDLDAELSTRREQNIKNYLYEKVGGKEAADELEKTPEGRTRLVELVDRAAEYARDEEAKLLLETARPFIDQVPEPIKNVYQRAFELAENKADAYWDLHARTADRVWVWLRDNYEKDSNIARVPDGYSYRSEAGNIVLRAPGKKGEGWKVNYTASTERVALNIKSEPPAITQIRQKAQGYQGEAGRIASDYIGWVIEGERGIRPDGGNRLLANKIAADLAGDLETLREYAASKSRGEPITLTVKLAGGTEMVKARPFQHGDYACIANVYKDGRLVAYLPENTETAKPFDANGSQARLLGLDPEDPNVWVYEVDGEIAKVNTLEPKAEPGYGKNKAGQYGMFSQGEDTPLFSGVAPRAQGEVFKPAEYNRQESLIDMRPQMKGAEDAGEAQGGEGQLFQRNQGDLFAQSVEDLPLFSGTPMRAQDEIFNPKPESPQMSMFPDLAPEAKPRLIAELAIRDEDGTAYVRIDLAKLTKIKQTLELYPDAKITYRILDAGGKVVRSGEDAREITAPQLRQSVEEMTPEELRHAIRHDELTGLKNRRAYDEAEKLPIQVVIDLEGLKYVNTVGGHAAGDAALQAMGRSMLAVSPESYRGSTRGDEFFMQFNTREEAEAGIQRVEELLKNEMIEITPVKEVGGEVITDGEPYKVRGMGFSAGIGESLAEADKQLTARKVFEQREGRRAQRGEKPVNMRPVEEDTAPVNIRPSDVPMGSVPLNGTPAPEPAAATLGEVNAEQVRPMLRRMRQEYKGQMGRESKFSDLDPASQKAVRDWLNRSVRSDMASTKHAAVKYGEQMRDSALLNYSRRYGADNFINLIFPYSFWYTRSMVNWSRRMIDKPSWFAMYARLKQAQEKMERTGMPTRLRGKMRMPMAWLPDWAGGGMWFDPVSKIFPPAQFGQPLEQYGADVNMINRRTEQILDDLVKAQEISYSEALAAKQSRSGKVWERAQTQAEVELDKSANPATLAGMMQTPALWWQIPIALASGKNAISNPLPITRTGQTIRTLGRDTLFEPITNLAGAVLAGPEEAIRKASKVSEFGDFGEYYIDRTLAAMAADGTVSPNDAIVAMMERNGPAYEEAVRRVQYEQAMRTPGAVGLFALKEGATPAQVISAFLTGIYGGSLFTDGELKYRQLKPEWDKAWSELNAGDEGAIDRFFEEHPEYAARMALYTDPEDRLHEFLVDEIYRRYFLLDKPNRQKANEALGREFVASFMDKETRSTETLDDRILATWAQQLGAMLPKVDSLNDLPAGAQPDYYQPAEVQAIQTYQAEREKRYPNYYAWQSAYYALPAGQQRKDYLKRYPKLAEYWSWKRQYSAEHPEIVPYLEDQKSNHTDDLATSELTAPLVRQIVDYGLGGQLSPGARSELERIRRKFAPSMSADEFIQMMVMTVMR